MARKILIKAYTRQRILCRFLQKECIVCSWELGSWQFDMCCYLYLEQEAQSMKCMPSGFQLNMSDNFSMVYNFFEVLK